MSGTSYFGSDRNVGRNFNDTGSAEARPTNLVAATDGGALLLMLANSDRNLSLSCAGLW